MNTKTILSLVFVASIFFTSCKKELEPQDSSETPLTEAVATPENPIEVTPQDATTTAPASTPMPVAPVQSSTAGATPTAAGMNPPHGQPNHRCDIAVGAPLNSPKANAPAPHNVPKPTSLEKPAAKTTLTQPTNAAVAPTAPGMNPPHGQPGHRCEIAVGAPLPTS
ncbi:hypothetical protein [Flavobacterium soli]|uniref:hypothetical protein n=1 Tax=Flavobacterium soli TaxID=344881 RepID=UPI0004091C10|nr:hypothetical protein [Flavobacterium soli]